MVNQTETTGDTFDAIVLGSGMGGMTTASLLAQVGKRRVLVLEQHTELGGQTHEFRRHGFSWDVGLHYVGEMEPKTFARRMMDLVTGGGVDWIPMPNEFECFSTLTRTIRVPSDFAEYRARLSAAFPRHVASIDRYFRDIRRASVWMVRRIAGAGLPAPLRMPLTIINFLGRRMATASTRSYLERHIPDPELRFLLTSQWGDYGLPPAESAFAIHALIVSHYAKGAWFPREGAGRIARAAQRQIEAYGGLCQAGWEVLGLVKHEGRVVGVRARPVDGERSSERVFSAPVVVSGLGLETTQRVFGSQDFTANPRLEKSLVEAHSAVILYLGLRDSAKTLGVQGENWWIDSGHDPDDRVGASLDLVTGKAREAYLSFPSLKNGDLGVRPTAEIIAAVDSSVFAVWETTESGQRGVVYEALKAKISQGLLALVEQRLPGFSALVAYQELATPLTIEHYTRRARGSFYGVPMTPAALKRPPQKVRTSTPGLYLCGSDVGSLGIVGALMGGVAAAARVLGSGGFPQIMAYRSRSTSANVNLLPRLTLEERIQRPGKTWELVWQSDRPLVIRPGQYLKLEVAPLHWREYSVLSNDGQRVRFLVSASTEGRGSHFAQTVALGAVVRHEGPFGSLRLDTTATHHVFVATGTGLAPLTSLMKSWRERGDKSSARVLFGCRYWGDDLTTVYCPSEVDLLVCASREPASPMQDGRSHGRVTTTLESLKFDSDLTAFYVAGSPSMVAEVVAILARRGARRVQLEKF